MSRIDLHIHTSYSGDGEFSPEEIVAQGILGRPENHGRV